MENEIKVNEYVRMIDGLIAKIVTKDKDDHFILDRYYAGGRHLTEIEVKKENIEISFDISEKLIAVSDKGISYNWINVDELQAINEKVKELKWE